jgi:hypothetical protein
MLRQDAAPSMHPRPPTLPLLLGLVLRGGVSLRVPLTLQGGGWVLGREGVPS